MMPVLLSTPSNGITTTVAASSSQLDLEFRLVQAASTPEVSFALATPPLGLS